jgi:hypothetical protein
VAIFAGGTTNVQFHGFAAFEVISDANILASICSILLPYIRARCAGGSSSLFIDLFNRVTFVWSTAQLSVVRYSLAATTVGKFALFAGGELDTPSAWFCRNIFFTFVYFCCALQ